MRFLPQVMKDVLKETGLKHVQAAEKVGCDRAMITQTCSGTRKPALSQLIHWADALGLDGPLRDEFLTAGIAAHIADEALLDHFVLLVERLDQIPDLQQELAKQSEVASEHIKVATDLRDQLKARSQRRK